MVQEDVERRRKMGELRSKRKKQGKGPEGQDNNTVLLRRSDMKYSQKKRQKSNVAPRQQSRYRSCCFCLVPSKRNDTKEPTVE